MNVYSELWALLRPEKSLDGGGALFGKSEAKRS